jgi:hypothetical protein
VTACLAERTGIPVVVLGSMAEQAHRPAETVEVTR